MTLSCEQRAAACVAFTLLAMLSVATSEDDRCPITDCPPIDCPYGFEYDANRCQLCECHHNPCDNFTCPDGEECQLQVVDCFTVPCYPIPECHPPAAVSTESPSTTKPGSCPTIEDGTVGICVTECATDAECPGNEKCCSNGCGRTCQKPIVCIQTVLCIRGDFFDTVLCRCVNPCENVTCSRDEVCEPQPISCGSRSCSPPAVGRCVKTSTTPPPTSLSKSTTTTKRGMCPAVANGTVGSCIVTCSSDAKCPANEKCCFNGCGRTCQKPVCIQNVMCIIGFVFDHVLCRCVNPCQNVACPTGESCHPQMTNCRTPPCSPPAVGRCERTTTRLPTRSTEPVVKPGLCPAVCNDTVGICIEGCRSDNDCPRRQKCCFNGCGHTCQKPVCDIMAKCLAGYVFDRVTCRCVNPCKNVTCPMGEICVSYLARNDSCEPRPVGRCEPRVHTCPMMPSPCNIRCRWGLKYDRNGCQLCECYDDPCKGHACPAGQVCKPIPLECLVAPCIPPFVPSCAKP